MVSSEQKGEADLVPAIRALAVIMERLECKTAALAANSGKLWSGGRL